MARDRRPLRMPRAGLEASPLVALWALPGGGRGPWLRLGRTGLAALVVYGGYQLLLSALRSETLRRQGLIDRRQQLLLIGDSLRESLPQGTAFSLGLGVLVLLIPALATPLSLLGAVGAGKASLDLFHAIWDGLNRRQQQHLLDSAHRAGVNLRRLLEGGSSGQRHDGLA